VASSVHYRSYWWPRRKLIHWPRTVRSLVTERGYNGQVAVRGSDRGSKDLDVLEVPTHPPEVAQQDPDVPNDITSIPCEEARADDSTGVIDFATGGRLSTERNARDTRSATPPGSDSELEAGDTHPQEGKVGIVIIGQDSSPQPTSQSGTVETILGVSGVSNDLSTEQIRSEATELSSRAKEEAVTQNGSSVQVTGVGKGGEEAYETGSQSTKSYTPIQDISHQPKIPSIYQVEHSRLDCNDGDNRRTQDLHDSHLADNPFATSLLEKDITQASAFAPVFATRNGTDIVSDEMQRSDEAEPESLPIRRVALSISEKIHVLGTGTVGAFIAHSLVGLADPPPVTLLLHRPLLMQQWHDEGETIRLIKDDKIVSKAGIKIESSARAFAESQDQTIRSRVDRLAYLARRSDSIIENLIVTTEGFATVAALLAIKHRLRNYSSICFIQDGLGIVDYVNSMVFPSPAYRPSYMIGSLSHDLQSMGSSFTIRERRPGTLSLAMVPPRIELTSQVRRMDFGWTIRSKYLMRTLCRSPELQAQGLLLDQFYKKQLERLAINSILGPLSVVYSCTNDQLLYNYQISRTMKLLIKEISLILQCLPEVSRVENIRQHFSPERLEILVLSVIAKTGKNQTSMLQAVRDGRRTDIDFHNGYLINRAVSLGIDCPNLEMIFSMVKGKQAMKNRERNSYIPFTDE